MTKEVPRLHPRPVPELASYDCEARAVGAADVVAFRRLSAVLTGFSEDELAATGMVQEYFDELGRTVGVEVRKDLLRAESSPHEMIQSEFYGPLIRNVIRMWYLGQWKQLPGDWIGRLASDQRSTFDEFGRNVDRVISARAYQEGLVWRALGVNPMGAKQPGFASWAEPPR